MTRRLVCILAAATIAGVLAPGPACAVPDAPGEAEAPTPEPLEARRARQRAERERAGGHAAVWMISAGIAEHADAAADAIGVPWPEVSAWYRPAGVCDRCSDAHARGGVTLVLDATCEEGDDTCLGGRRALRALAAELSRRLGRHYRVSVVELRAQTERHTAFRNGEADGRPFPLRRRETRDVIIVRPDSLLPTPAALVYGEPDVDPAPGG